MVNVEEINRSILELEKHDTSYATCERLAWLYIVRDHIINENKSNERTGALTGNEFCEACADKPLASVMEIISEHMESIKILYPRTYRDIIQKITEI